MKKFFKLSALAAAVAALTQLTGCGTISDALNVGEEEFACNGMPGSVYCHSARDVYEKTADGVVPNPVSRAEGSYNENCTDCIRAEDVNPALAVEEDGNSQYAITEDGRRLEVVDGRISYDASGNKVVIKDGKTVPFTGDEVIDNYVTPALPDSPVPIRTPAQVMRIWVAPYVDTAGDLIAPGFVYTEVESRRWIYPGDESTASARQFNPLKPTIQTGSRYASPQSYSNPKAAKKQDSDGGYNSLLKYRRDRAKAMEEMRANGGAK